MHLQSISISKLRIKSTEITLLNLTGTSLALNWRGREIHEHAYTIGKNFCETISDHMDFYEKFH